MVEDGVTGVLVPHDRPEALAAAIVRLLTDRAFAERIAKGGHDLVHDRFCIELMVREVEDLYEEGAARVRQPRVAAG
jgi:glycosyltransferase involved in cell wall biosynthesis